MSAKKWQILVVDDEKDIHAVTRLALKYQSYDERGFELTSAHSGESAKQLLGAPDCPRFDVALVDVIMETDTAGVELCAYMKEKCPGTAIVLRTGQPGGANEAELMKKK